MRTGIFINVGSGVHPCPGWINLDSYTTHAPIEVQGSALALPFGECCADRVFFGHTLEHLSYDDTALVALREAYRVLKVGGELGVVGPAMDLALEQGEPQNIIDAIAVTPFDPEHPGWGHLWTADSVNTLELVQGVFANAHIVPVAEIIRRTGWPNTVASTWQVAILASAQ